MLKRLIKSIYEYLVNLTRSGMKGSFDEESVRKTVVVNLFSVVGIFFMTAFGIKSLKEGLYIHASILFIADFLTLIVAVYLRLTKNYNRAAVYMVLLLMILELYFLVSTTPDEDYYLWYYVFPALCLFSLNSKKGSFFVFLLLSITVGLFIWQPEFMYSYATDFKIRFISTNLALFLMAYVFERVREKNYQSLMKLNEKKTYFLIKVLEQKKQILLQSKQLEMTNKELEKLSLVAEKTDNAVAIMDPKGNLKWINKGFTRMYGYNLKQLRQNNAKPLIGKNANLKLVDLISVWFGDKKPITFEAMNETRYGTKLWAQTTLTPILGKDGRIDKLVSIDTDITDLKKAHQQIEEKNKDITSSLQYAKRIQEALLPSEQTIKSRFNHSFIYYKPKQIVSGDFYWTTVVDNTDILVVADCTGHGVPGALMSMIGITFLNKIIIEKNITEPSEILDRLRINVINTFIRKEKETETYDGMDISVISIDRDTHQLKFAGAINPLYIIRDDEIIEFKADRMPIGYHELQNISFKQTTFEVNKKDMIYLFTDGYVDQFGGLNGKKFKYGRFRDLLISIYNEDPATQKEALEETMVAWMNKRDQIDDILIIGIRYD